MYKNYTLNTVNFKDLEDFLLYAKEENIEVICFVTPSHVSDLINIYEAGLWNDYKKFKYTLAKICNYYDFSILDDYTTEDITPKIKYFRDSAHATGYYGEMMVNRLLGISNISGAYITSKNIDEEFSRNEAKLINYTKTHKLLTEKVKEWR